MLIDAYHFHGGIHSTIYHSSARAVELDGWMYMTKELSFTLPTYVEVPITRGYCLEWPTLP